MSDLAPSPDWRDICQSLWGDDWMQAAADVIGVNRRTIERWRAGQQTIPRTVVEALELALIEDVNDRRAYGALLRRLALSADPHWKTLWNIADEAQRQFNALEQLRGDLHGGRLLGLRGIADHTDPTPT